MPRFVHLISSLLVGAVATTTAFGQTVKPGSKAPSLSVKKWYKGTAVKSFNPSKTYVVEFWATWCGPCIESIPHISELAKKNKDVTFIGVSIWEDDNGKNIKDFVANMGDKMSYNVGYSGNQKGMGESWMKAAGQNGIPTAFVIKNNKVQWIGHPMEMEKPLAEIKSGKFDLKGFSKKFSQQAAENERAMASEKEIRSIQASFDAGKITEAKSKIAAFSKKYPSETGRLVGIKLQIQFKEDAPVAEAQLNELAGSTNEQITQTLIFLAMNQMGPKGDVDLGDKIMNLITGLARKGDSIRFYYGAVYFAQRNDKKLALELIDKAIEELPNGSLKDNDGAKKAFEEMKKELAGG
ncbi:MAG TPA: TlpA disulfide reductase family protein [Fimbriimonas sp.]|nr:TlpA disulfide reductase family protein [Fimbriimonas sp.]